MSDPIPAPPASGAPTAPPPPPAVDLWGPAQVKPTRPVGMGDVILGFVYSQVFASIPAILGLMTVVAANPGLLTSGENVDTAGLLGGPAIVATLLASWAGFLLASFWAGTRKGDKDWRALLRWRFSWWDIPIGLGFAAGAILAQVALGWILTSLGVDTSELSNTGMVTDQTGIWLVLMAVGAAVGAPIVEEIFFRGLFLSVAVRNYGKAAGVIFVSVVFGLMHMQGTVEASLAVCSQTALIGAMLALLVLRTNRLGSSIASHMGVNTAGVILALLGSNI